jgi:hypothetical protein
MTKFLKYDNQTKSLHLEISRRDLHLIIESLNALIEKRRDKFYDDLEKEDMERCRELLHSLYEIAAKDLPKRSF